MNVGVEVDSQAFEAWTKKLVAETLNSVEAVITNDVFYVPRLEYGYSKQAPHGMVRVSLREIGDTLSMMLGKVNWNEVAMEGHVRVTVIDRVNRTADYGMQLIRDRTPIRTGRARRGWRVVEAQ